MYMTVKKKVLWIAGLIVLAAIVIVLCVGYFASARDTGFDGTLVKTYDEFPELDENLSA